MAFARMLSAVSMVMAGSADTVGAQNLGPFRQFLAIDGAYSRLELDAGDGNDRIGLNGYGGRLWINLAPFLGPGRGVKDHTAIALFYFTAPRGDNEIFTRHYGAELDFFPLHVPIGNLIDPFVALSAGRFRLDNGAAGGTNSSVDIERGSRHYLSVTPAVGIRVPVPNRFQLRFDAGDLILFNRRDAAGEGRTSHNVEFKAGLGLTF